MPASDSSPTAAPAFNRVPVSRRVLADLDTPLSVYLKLAAAPYSYLLESVQGGEKWGRYSIIGLPARCVLTVRGHEITVTDQGSVVERHQCADPLAFIREFHARYHAPSLDASRFSGGRKNSARSRARSRDEKKASIWALVAGSERSSA